MTACQNSSQSSGKFKPLFGFEISPLLRHIKTMTIALAKDVEDFLREQVRTGVCDDASDLVNEVLRTVRNQQIRPFAVTPEVEAWLLEAADKPTTPLTEADFCGIRERVSAGVRFSGA
jgi:Arc/MetJ-type ribon-helix-helix transcriptional regulator